LDEKGLSKINVDRTSGGSRPRTMKGSGPTRNQVYRYQPEVSQFKKSRGARYKLIASLFAFVSILAFGMAYFSGQFLDDKLHLELKAEPSAVNLAINSKPLNKGSFMHTPLKLHLKPGSYQLVLSRPGFLPKIIDFQGNGGDIVAPPVVVLERIPGVQTFSLQVLAKERRLYVNLDGGLAKGPTPLVVADVLANVPHNLTFSVGDGDAKKILRCVFKPTLATQAKGYTITIDPDAQDRSTCLGRSH
jgi:hypothetical protein